MYINGKFGCLVCVCIYVELFLENILLGVFLGHHLFSMVKGERERDEITQRGMR